MTFLKKIAGSNGHSKSGSVSSIRYSANSQASPSASVSSSRSFKTHVRNSSNSTDYSGSTYVFGTGNTASSGSNHGTPTSSKTFSKMGSSYNRRSIDSPRSTSNRNSEYTLDNSSLNSHPQANKGGDNVSRPTSLEKNADTDSSTYSRKSSGSTSSLSFDNLILSWDPTNPDEWTLSRVIAWFKFHDFPDSWIAVFKRHQLCGQRFLRLLAYDNFAIYEKHLPISKNASFDKFQALLKDTMKKNVSSSHSRQRSGNSVAAMHIEPNKGVNLRHKSSRSQDDIVGSRSASESGINNEQLNLGKPPEKGVVKSHKKTKSTGSLYRRSFISLMGSSSHSSAENTQMEKNNPNIKIHIPSRPQSVVESEPSTAKTLSPLSPPYSALFNKLDQKNRSDPTLFEISDEKYSRLKNDDYNDDIAAQSSSTNFSGKQQHSSSATYSKSKKNEKGGFNVRNSAVMPEDKSTFWEKLKRKSQTISPSTQNHTQLNSANLSKNRVSLQQIQGGFDMTDQVKPDNIVTPKIHQAHKSSSIDTKSQNFENVFDKFLLDKKYYPVKIKSSTNEEDFVLITKDNVSFIPLLISELPNECSKLKEYFMRKLRIVSGECSVHMTDFGCDIGASLNDTLLDTIRNSLFMNTSRKLFIRDTGTHKYSPGKPIINSSQREMLRKKESIKSINSSILASNDEISTITSSSDIASFDDRSSAPGRQYPQTPSYFYDASNVNDDVNYWNFKENQSSLVPGKVPDVKPEAQFTLKIPDKIKHKGLEDDLQRNSFHVLRKDEGKEIDFNNRRRSPYTNPELAPKREAPKAPITGSPMRLQKSRSLSKSVSIVTNNDRSRRDELSPSRKSYKNSETNSPSSEKIVSSYTPGSSHVLVPQPYKGVGDISRKGKLEDDHIFSMTEVLRSRVNRSTSSVSNNSVIYSTSPILKRGSSKRIVSSASAADVFEENTINFNDVPELSDSDEDSASSEDIIWGSETKISETEVVPENNNFNKTDSEDDDKIYSMNNKLTPVRKMTLRPTAEIVYQNLERFFPRAHLDKPVVEELHNSKSPVSKTSDKARINSILEQHSNISEKGVKSQNNDNVIKEKKSNTSLPRRTRTIRAIAHEAGEARRNSMKVKRSNTKMWGTKIVEITDKNTIEINKSKNARGEYKEFAWMKGEMIGKGSFGAVYLSLNITTGEMMAVKQVEVPKYGTQNELVKDMVEALKSEVATLKDLDHLNIVQYLGSEIRGNIYSLFLEYVAGGSVGSLIRLYGRFDEKLIRHLNTQVLSGLKYLHSKGILHRDMKADNLLLDEDGICKISDFGISKKSKNIYSNSDMTMRGTVFWMAPEMVDTKQGYSAKVDIWSLGCVVLEMFAGKRPWSNLEVVAAMFQIGKSKSAPPIPDDTIQLISSKGKDFLSKCFEIDPEKRPTADDLLEHSFSKVDPAFNFSRTRLYEFIKTNDKLNSSVLRNT
ncbi:Serine/Threonine protein kinases active-site signature [Nakaseomyces glabratus]|nr:Serine/Threonine protein kinases active-site signature [Nakaseomyces glabratus]KAH7594979.1 Serine/Threonine protein kinases active-site signature [Nakaseomyces glabratus]KAH7611062.1 Serine/Threonine protein kinases active-site signature [Nakaseomyces glabratus]